MSDTLLRNQEIWLKISSPAVGQLWLWHAIEETEHKAVCFDVYRAVTGHNRVMAYLNRVFAMGLTSLVLLFGVLLAISLISGNSTRQGTLPAKPTSGPKGSGKVRHNHRNPLRMLASLVPWRLYFDYYRPSFHPWKHDNAHLVTQWQARFPDFGSPHGSETGNSAAR